MSEQATPRKRFRRWKYIIDWKQQLGPTSQIVGFLIAVCVVYVIGMYFFTRDEPAFEMRPEEFKSMLLKAYAVYLIVSVAIFIAMTISMTHRFVGPAFVLQRAVEGMRKGERGNRVKLRRTDHLQGLAEAVEELRTWLAAGDAERSKALEDLESCLRENDLDGARELVARLRQTTPPEPVEEPAATA